MPVETWVTLSEADSASLREMLFTPDNCENFAVLLCGIASNKNWRRYLVREVIPSPLEAYVERLPYHLEISPRYINTIVDRALSSGLTPIVVHSHPIAGKAQYSPSDDFGEGRLLPVLAQLVAGPPPISLLFTESDAVGRYLEKGSFVSLSEVQIRGLSSTTFRKAVPNRMATAPTYDRQIRVFGELGQLELSQIRAGVIGVGGTGSAVAEQLVRLGVNDIKLVDYDELEESNISRLLGAVPADLRIGGQKKVLVVAAHLKRINPSARIEQIGDSVLKQSVLKQLRDRDIIFGCTDNHLSRAVLNRFSHQYLVPMADMGIRLDARKGAVSAVGGRVSLVGSGLVCLRCSHHFDPAMVRAEGLSGKEREQLTREGYIQGIEERQPAVISLNTTIAGLAVTMGLSTHVSLVGKPPPLDLLYDASGYSLFTVAAKHEDRCDICSQSHGVRGLGDRQVVSAYD
jgi:molybdopterin-synthase adenylyltransferase